MNKVQRQTAVKGVANILQKETGVSVVDVHSKQSGVGGKKEKAKHSKKRKSQVPDDIDSDSDNEQSKKKRGSKLSMAEAMYEAKKIDAEIQKREQELRKELAEKSENEVNRRHELVMLKAQERKIELQVQAAIRKAEAEERREEAKLQTLQFEMQLAAMRNSRD